MLRSDSISLHVPEPLALIDATLLFTVQVLIARPPELLLPPEVTVLHPPPGLRAARRLLDGIRELHGAIEAYRDLLTGAGGDRRLARPIEPDEIPFYRRPFRKIHREAGRRGVKSRKETPRLPALYEPRERLVYVAVVADEGGPGGRPATWGSLGESSSGGRRRAKKAAPRQIDPALVSKTVRELRSPRCRSPRRARTAA